MPRQLPAPFQAAAFMLLPADVTATAWLSTCDIISARQCSYPVSALSACTVACDCLKVGPDFVSTDLQAVARHFGRLERMA